MELSEELASLNLKQIEVEIIEVQNEFQTSYCDNNTTTCRICLERSHLNKMCSIFDPVKPVHIYSMIMSCASVQVKS